MGWERNVLHFILFRQWISPWTLIRKGVQDLPTQSALFWSERVKEILESKRDHDLCKAQITVRKGKR